MKFSDNLIRAINAVNQDVAADVDLSDVSEHQQYLIMAETCIDANRLTERGFPEADEELHRLIAEYGYSPVLEEAVRHVSLW